MRAAVALVRVTISDSDVCTRFGIAHPGLDSTSCVRVFCVCVCVCVCVRCVCDLCLHLCVCCVCDCVYVCLCLPYLCLYLCVCVFVVFVTVSVRVYICSHRVVGLITRKELTEHTIHEAGTVLNEQLNDEYVCKCCSMTPNVVYPVGHHTQSSSLILQEQNRKITISLWYLHVIPHAFVRVRCWLL